MMSSPVYTETYALYLIIVCTAQATIRRACNVGLECQNFVANCTSEGLDRAATATPFLLPNCRLAPAMAAGTHAELPQQTSSSSH